MNNMNEEPTTLNLDRKKNDIAQSLRDEKNPELITKISAKFSQINDKDLDLLNRFTNLKSIDCSRSKVTRKKLQNIVDELGLESATIGSGRTIKPSKKDQINSKRPEGMKPIMHNNFMDSNRGERKR